MEGRNDIFCTSAKAPRFERIGTSRFLTMSNSHFGTNIHALCQDENASLPVGPNLRKSVARKRLLPIKGGQNKGEFELQTLNPNAAMSSRSRSHNVLAPASLHAVGPLEMEGAVVHLRYPEPAHTKSRTFDSYTATSMHDSASTLANITPTQSSLQTFVPISLRNDYLLDDGKELDLSPVIKQYHGDADYPPFFHYREYEKALDQDDYEGICLATLQAERQRLSEEGNQSTFDKQLELNEASSMVGWFDYVLYSLLGKDRTGYFSLKQEREDFYARPWLRFTGSAEYSDCESHEYESSATEESI